MICGAKSESSRCSLRPVSYTHLAEELFGIPREQFLEMFRDDLSAAVSLPKKYGYPLLTSSFLDENDDYIAAYQAHEIPVYDAPEKAARAMVALWKYRQVQQRVSSDPPVLPPAAGEAAALIAEAVNKGCLLYTSPVSPG